MERRVRFALVALGWSLALFGAWYSLKQSSGAQMLDEIVYALPVAALVLASSGPWRRRTSIAVGLVGVLAVGASLAYATDIAPLAQAQDSFAAHAAAVAYHVFRYAVPLAVLVWVTGGQVSSLWEPEPKRRAKPR